MTAINAIATKAGAYVMTDAVAYNDDGVVQRFMTKARPLLHLNAVIATSGATGHGEYIALCMGRFQSFEEAVAGLSHMLREEFESGALDFGRDDLNNLTLLFAGWSTVNKRGEVYAIETDDRFGGAPFSLIGGGGAAISFPAIRDKAAHEYARLSATATPEELLLFIIQEQRKQKSGITQRHLVGGSANLTVINAAGIVQRQVLKWPDRIGETINPARAVVETREAACMIPTELKLSRHERRAVEARARKAS